MLLEHIKTASQVILRQQKHFSELVGYETRNKYSVELPGGEKIGFAAEQGKSILGTLVRQILGHWRTFEIHIFDQQMQLQIVAKHPFRFLFQRLEVSDSLGKRLGAVQQRFAILHKRFDIENSLGETVMTVSSPLWRLWTFPVTRNGAETAMIKKVWGGVLKEAFTDADTFSLDFTQPGINIEERLTLLAATLFIDLQYFEKKARLGN